MISVFLYQRSVLFFPTKSVWNPNAQFDYFPYIFHHIVNYDMFNIFDNDRSTLLSIGFLK